VSELEARRSMPATRGRTVERKVHTSGFFHWKPRLRCCVHPAPDPLFHRSEALRAEGPKPRFITRGNHAGTRSFERSSTPEAFGALWCRRGDAVYLSPVARSLPAYRTGESPEEERGSRLRTREGADMVTDWSRSLARLLRSLAPRSSRGTSSHAPGAQLKIERVPSTGVREGNALICSDCDFSGCWRSAADRGTAPTAEPRNAARARFRAAIRMRHSHRAIQRGSGAGAGVDGCASPLAD
jgi:hypothetical protein